MGKKHSYFSIELLIFGDSYFGMRMVLNQIQSLSLMNGLSATTNI